MKYKLLATCVAVAVLAGCNGSDEEIPTTRIQAYDGAVSGMGGTYTCENESGTIPKTGSDGFASVASATLKNETNTCSFTFNATPGAKDESNNKDMSSLSLSIPKGLIDSGGTPKATPITTLVNKALAGAEYNESTATEVLTKLGLYEDLVNTSGFTLAEVMADLPSVVKSVNSGTNTALKAKVFATTNVLAAVLAKNTVTDVTKIATATLNVAKKTVAQNPNYPASSEGTASIDLDNYDLSTLTDNELDVSAIPDVPVKVIPDEDTTGGTGGTGTGSDGSGTGED